MDCIGTARVLWKLATGMPRPGGMLMAQLHVWCDVLPAQRQARQPQSADNTYQINIESTHTDPAADSALPAQPGEELGPQAQARAHAEGSDSTTVVNQACQRL